MIGLTPKDIFIAMAFEWLRKKDDKAEERKPSAKTGPEDDDVDLSEVEEELIDAKALKENEARVAQEKKDNEEAEEFLNALDEL